jgi:hypothetical protein
LGGFFNQGVNVFATVCNPTNHAAGKNHLVFLGGVPISLCVDNSIPQTLEGSLVISPLKVSLVQGLERKLSCSSACHLV